MAFGDPPSESNADPPRCACALREVADDLLNEFVNRVRCSELHDVGPEPWWCLSSSHNPHMRSTDVDTHEALSGHRYFTPVREMP